MNFLFKLKYYLSSRNYLPGFNTFHRFISNILIKLISNKYFLIINLTKKKSYKKKVIKYKSYKDYLAWQKWGNSKKENSVWVDERNIKKIIKFLNLKRNNKYSVCCMGSRNGSEMKFFKKHLSKKSSILGFEVSETGSKYQNTVVQDFNILNKRYINKFDIIYSNSHDHMFDEKKTLKIWSQYLKKNGILVLDQRPSHGALYNDHMDPSAFESEVLPFEILINFQNKMSVYAMIDPEGFSHNDSIQYRSKIIFIKKNN
jgi:hypothetical protein